MNNLHHRNYSDIEAFLEACKEVGFTPESKAEAYSLIEETLFTVRYWSLPKKKKATVREYLKILTGYSKAQLTRLIKEARKGGLKPAPYKRHGFPRRYTDNDICLLAMTDKFHGVLNGNATRQILRRQFEVFKDGDYERLAKISVAHIYNLRKTVLYAAQTRGLRFTKTKYAPVSIGERTKPQPDGRPGYIRVDTVHQGDKDGEKGAYHINSIDEVTQYEIVGSVEKISDKYLLPLLKDIIALYPFVIVEFHADNGGEYINYQVAAMLNNLLIKLTKSRPRKTNDNALVEGKNGSIVRKHMGYIHIPAHFAPLVNEFYMTYLNPYLNFHRPCAFVTDTTISKHGKQKKVYGQYMTPYEKLKSLEGAEQYLKKGVSFDSLDRIAYAMSDNEAAVRILTPTNVSSGSFFN